MAHETIERQLVALVEGSLSSSDEQRVREHVASCEDCSEWVTTYYLLMNALTESADEHAGSEQIADYAVYQREALGGKGLEEHVQTCTSCGEEATLARRAVVEARVPQNAMEAGLERLRQVSMPFRLAMAASLLLFLVVTGSLVVGNHDGTSAVDLELAAQKLMGKQTIEAERSISAGSVVIEGESVVDFRAGEMVVLESGFSVAEGATFTIETTSDPVLELEASDGFVAGDKPRANPNQKRQRSQT